MFRRHVADLAPQTIALTGAIGSFAASTSMLADVAFGSNLIILRCRLNVRVARQRTWPGDLGPSRQRRGARHAVAIAAQAAHVAEGDADRRIRTSLHRGNENGQRVTDAAVFFSECETPRARARRRG